MNNLFQFKPNIQQNDTPLFNWSKQNSKFFKSDNNIVFEQTVFNKQPKKNNIQNIPVSLDRLFSVEKPMNTYEQIRPRYDINSIQQTNKPEQSNSHQGFIPVFQGQTSGRMSNWGVNPYN